MFTQQVDAKTNFNNLNEFAKELYIISSLNGNDFSKLLCNAIELIIDNNNETYTEKQLDSFRSLYNQINGVTLKDKIMTIFWNYQTNNRVALRFYKNK